jgi:UDP-3-O-[3-hydroxymyristoyl] glucosamine N-acyltransferase
MSAEQRTFTAAALAEKLGGRLAGSGEAIITGVNALDEAGENDITFLADTSHARRWGQSRAIGAVVSEGIEPVGHNPQRRVLIYVPVAELAMVTVLELFQPAQIVPEIGIHPTAWVDERARLGEGVRIGPHVSIDRDCDIGDGVILHAGVRLYAGVSVGAGSVLNANCVVRQGCRIGRAVIIHQNASIGADGFGYVPASDGRGLLKVPQIGTVILEDGVELGAGACIDRAKFGATVIGAGAKIDNLVQIGHNCRIGRSTVIAGLTGIAGSCTIGDGVIIGGAVGIADHLRIGDGATIGAKSGVMKDIPPGETWLGYPADPAAEKLRQWATIRKLPGLVRRMSRDAEGEQRPPRPPRASD